jgi:hypothetical protein
MPPMCWRITKERPAAAVIIVVVVRAAARAVAAETNAVSTPSPSTMQKQTRHFVRKVRWSTEGVGIVRVVVAAPKQASSLV